MVVSDKDFQFVKDDIKWVMGEILPGICYYIRGRP